MLLASNIFVLNPPNHPQNIQVWSRSDGSPVVPFFTSLPALQRATDKVQSYMELPSRSLFEITKGASLVLNPKSSYGKEFFPAEIEALLATGASHQAMQRVADKPTQVLLGQPADYPQKLVDTLAAYFKTRTDAKAAYLCFMQDPRDPQPHLVIGIQGNGDLERLVREAGSIAADVMAGKAIDIVRVTPGEEGLSRYLLESTKPFYAAK